MLRGSARRSSSKSVEIRLDRTRMTCQTSPHADSHVVPSVARPVQHAGPWRSCRAAAWGVRDGSTGAGRAPRRVVAAMAGSARRAAVDREPGHVRAAERPCAPLRRTCCRGEPPLRRCGCRVKAAAAVDGTVKGVVFQDFGSTGFYTTGNAATGEPRNRPIAGVTATAYDADGDQVGTATSGSDGDLHDQRQRARGPTTCGSSSPAGTPTVYQPGFAAQTAIPAELTGRERHVGAVRRARHAGRRARRPRPGHPRPGDPGERADRHGHRVRRGSRAMRAP